MTFEYQWLPKYDLKSIDDGPNGRVYQTPIGELPSVTSVLKSKSSEKALEQWRERVGHDVAAQISQSASNRGNAVHKIAENYLLGKEWKKGEMTLNISSFNKIRPYLENISHIYGLEHKLFSKELHAAGTADLIARWLDRFNVVADYKTSKRVLIPSSPVLKKYRYQATAYSIMIEELYGIEVKYNVIFIVIDGEPKPQIDLTNNHQFRKSVRRIFKKGLQT